MRPLLLAVLFASSWSLARDPFAKPAGDDARRSTCTTSLCKHEVSELKLVAIAGRGPEAVAMFENALGKGFVVRRNAEVGSGGACVTQIDAQCLTLTRFTSAADGRFHPVSERVCLAAGEQGAEHDYLTDGPYRIPDQLLKGAVGVVGRPRAGFGQPRDASVSWAHSTGVESMRVTKRTGSGSCPLQARHTSSSDTHPGACGCSSAFIADRLEVHSCDSPESRG